MQVNIINGWISPFTEDEVNEAFGFVYLIRNTETGMWYVGKKQSKSKITRPPLKGKKRKRIEYKVSNWKEYWSSSDKLQSHILTEGEEKFQRIILAICATKIDLSYSEVECQVMLNAVASDKSFNGVLGATQYGSLHSGIKRNGLDWINSVFSVSPEVFYDSPVIQRLMQVMSIEVPNELSTNAVQLDSDGSSTNTVTSMDDSVAGLLDSL